MEKTKYEDSQESWYFINDGTPQLSLLSFEDLPSNFIYKHFMSVNHADKDELLSFQQSFGMIGSLLFDKRGEDRYPDLTPLGDLWWYSDERRACELSGKLGAHLQTFVMPTSLEEASASIANVQMLINATIKSSGVDRSTTCFNSYDPLSHFFAKLVSRIIGNRFPVFEYHELVPIQMPAALPLLEFIVIAHARNLISESGWRECENCGSFFPTRPTKNPSYIKRYCTHECQNKAKSKRQRERIKADTAREGVRI